MSDERHPPPSSSALAKPESQPDTTVPAGIAKRLEREKAKEPS